MPKVALLIQAANGFNRRIIMGVSAFGREQGGWDFCHPAPSSHHLHHPKGEVRVPKDWYGQGIIFRATSHELWGQINQLSIPSVNVSRLGLRYENMINVVASPTQCGALVGKYIASKEFDSVGYVGVPSWQGYSEELERAMTSAMSPTSQHFSTFEFPSQVQYESDLRVKLGTWIQTLPKPVCIATWSTDQARIVIALCRQMQLDVPAQVSVVSCENDELSAALAPVSITSVNQHPYRVGYYAAKVLQSLMSGEELSQTTYFVPPIDVVERESSNALMACDEFVIRCMETVDSHLSIGISCKTLASKMGVSRRTLEKRLMKALNKTPSQIIDSVKLRRGKRLLADTDMFLEEIAQQTGFSSAASFARFFKRQTDMTPIRYRNPPNDDV